MKKATNEEIIWAFEEQVSYGDGVLETFGNKLKEDEEALEEKAALINKFVEKIKHLEERQDCLIGEAKEKCLCNEFDFKTYNKTGLKIHKLKMRNFKSFNQCEVIFTTARKLKIHTYTHSYTSNDLKLTCKSCAFEANQTEVWKFT